MIPLRFIACGVQEIDFSGSAVSVFFFSPYAWLNIAYKFMRQSAVTSGSNSRIHHVKMTSVPEVDTLMRNASFDSGYMLCVSLADFVERVHTLNTWWWTGEVCTVDASVAWPRWLPVVDIWTLFL